MTTKTKRPCVYELVHEALKQASLPAVVDVLLDQWDAAELIAECPGLQAAALRFAEQVRHDEEEQRQIDRMRYGL